FISPSTTMPTAAASKPCSDWLSVSERKASPLAVCSCPKATIRTPSSSRAVMPDSSKLSLRLPSHEVPPGPSADLPQRTKSDSRRRANYRPRGWLDQSLLGSRIRSPLGKHEPARIRLQSAAFRPLVGECLSHRRPSGRGPERVHAPGICALPVQPTASACSFWHQCPRRRGRSRYPQRIPRGSLPDRP